MRQLKIIMGILMGFLPFVSCSAKAPKNPYKTATEIRFWHDNGSVAPQYHQKETYVVTPDSITKTVKVEDGSATASLAITKDMYVAFCDSLAALALDKRKKSDEGRQKGGPNYGLSVNKDGQSVFSAGHEDGRQVVIPQLKDLFGDLYRKASYAQYETATEFCHWYNNGSVAPQCQMTVSYSVTRDSMSRSLNTMTGVTRDKFAISKEDFQEFYACLMQLGLEKPLILPRRMPLPPGSNTVVLSIFKGDACLFGSSNSAGTLPASESVISRVFESLFNKYKK